MAEPAGELPPLPPVAAEPPANPEHPAEPPAGPLAEALAEPAAQPAAANQVISSSGAFRSLLALAARLCAFRVFSPTFLVLCLAYLTFHVSLGHIFVFLFAFVSVVRICISFYSVLLFRLVCVSFGSGSRFFRLGRNIFVLYVRFCPRHELLRLLSGTARLWGRLSFRNELLYIRSGTVRLREPGFCLNQVFGVCGPGPFSSGSRVLFKTKYLVYAVRDRSALEPAFVSERIVLYTVRDRSAPGAGFCLKPRI